MSVSDLPEPTFVEIDPSVITAEMVEQYEGLVGKILQPAQPERLFIDFLAYRETLIKTAIQEAAKQNLLFYAGFPVVDYLGDLLSVERLAAQPARTVMRFTLVSVQAFDVLIPAGTRIETKDAKFRFATEAAATVAAGQTTVEANAAAQTAGSAANGYLAGEIASLLDPVAFVTSAVNTSVSMYGSDEEDTEHYKERIRQAPESFSIAGPEGAYRFLALSAHQLIIAVAVTSPDPCYINVYPLTTTGNPDQTMIDLVTATLTPKKKRPLGDRITVLAPTAVAFTIETDVTLYDWADATSTKTAIETALAGYAATMRQTLGQNGNGIVRAQISAVIKNVSGVYNCPLVAPAADTELADNEWANCTGITVNLVGVKQ